MTDRPKITISGGDLRYANIGNERNTQNNYYGTEDRTIAVAALRTALDERGDRVVALGRHADERAVLRHEVDATRRVLATDEPDGTAVRVRWQAVLAILGTTLAMNADVAQISQFVMDLFGR